MNKQKISVYLNQIKSKLNFIPQILQCHKADKIHMKIKCFNLRNYHKTKLKMM